VAGDDGHGIRQGEKPFADGAEDFSSVTARQVGATDGAGEEGVSGDQELLGREVEANAALGVPGGVDYLAGDIRQADFDAIVGARVGWGYLRRLNAEPSGLHLHHGELGQVVLVDKNRCAGDALEAYSCAHVVDVAVRDDDLFESELVGGQAGEDFGEVFAGVDDDGVARGLIAEDGAVAAKNPDREGFKNHGASLGMGLESIGPVEEPAIWPAFLESRAPLRLERT
jgi:hypothetical protein